MSAVWLKIIAVVSVCCTAPADAGNREVVWRDLGKSFTIQCRGSPDQEYLTLRMGLKEETEVFFIEKGSAKPVVAEQYRDRLQWHGEVPKMDILIQNLSVEDTGPYWCAYRMFDAIIRKPVSTKGNGSVLLVVTDDKREATDLVKACDPHQDLVLVSVVISAAVLLCILLGFLIMIIVKNRRLQGNNRGPVSPDTTKSLHTSVAPRRLPTNDVYEDMRGTFRR